MDNHAPLLERAFSLDVQEQSCTIDRIEGAVPDYVRGTYYLNGPARFSRDTFRYKHWLDGDGMVCSLRFEPDGIRFTNRFVRSQKFVDEAEAGRPLYRAFGTAFESDQLVRGIALASPVNVSAYPFANTLLAFGEQGLPYELDPITLETRGLYTFGKRLNAISPFSAHPKFDPDTGEMFNFGISFSATQPALNLYRFDRAGKLDYRKRFPIDFPCSIHDFTISQQYAIFYLSPYILDMEALMRDGCSLLEALKWEPERGSQLFVISRETGEAVATIPVGEGYCLHLANAFEADGQLTVDLLELTQPVYDQYQVVPDLFPDVREALPVRFVVDLAHSTLVERRELGYRMMCDFPGLDLRKATRECSDFWVLGISNTPKAGRKFLDQLAHLNWDREDGYDIYQAPPKHYLGGEPVFIGNPDDPHDGVVICQMFDAEQVTSAFVLFDAFHVAKGPVATLHLAEPVHLGFHACFEPA